MQGLYGSPKFYSGEATFAACGASGNPGGLGWNFADEPCEMNKRNFRICLGK